ncbi:2-hydroxymuconate semialdehyde hydrolase [Candidatus Phycosocius bacilliformis]|uniref:2-hydroxymuconate semialdehyde hydrolase n=1 Tax=Candidatus Phycosocius bacilliformis TaxID=1445552 RepID=A0A2P2E8N8_9PROT|nr:alpha/beta fold hydrolase [Candidatus Phycosocius bacilliformis]GBF57427.1 2-hydroxymuconate semialdehyde hydrolase [Candidatus Phycosocius bacilliformis]
MSTQTHTSVRHGHYERVTLGGRTVRAAVWRAHLPGIAGKDRPRPILFFNGIGANIELMAPLADWFADRDIITFDMPGVGKSPNPILPYRPWMMCAFAVELLDYFGFGVVDVMGVSWGGAMAQQFAWQNPKRTGRLLLAATSMGMVMVPGDPEVLMKMASPRRYVDKDYMLANFRTLYGGESKGSDGHASRLLPPSTIGYMQQLACMMGWTSAWFLPFLQTKTLVMMGDKDRIVPEINGRWIASLAPNARLHIVKGGGHLFLVSFAETIVPVMRDFFDEGEVWHGKTGDDHGHSQAA